jgi:hypothetical protein
MKDHILENSIRIIRNLMEEGMVVGTGGFTGSADPKGPVAGYDSLMDGRSKMMRRLPPLYKKQLSKSKKKDYPDAFRIRKN